MSDTPDVCVRGGGIVGRTLALLLARGRLRVALHVPDHQAPLNPEHSDVRAYALNAHARGLLESLRSWPDSPHATPVLAMQVQAGSGNLLSFNAADQHVSALNWIVDVPVLEQQLREAVRYQSGIELVDHPVDAPLNVVCEGRNSATRAELGVEFPVINYPQHAIAFRASTSAPHAQVARQWFQGGRILAYLPMQGETGNSIAVVWSVPKGQVARLLGLSEEEFLAEVAADSEGALGSLTLASRRVSWPLQLGRASTWIGAMPSQPSHSWALAGDAAHAMHPLAGQGLNVGLADAAELARVLLEREPWRPVSDLKLLRRYARARQADVRAMQLTTDSLQQLFWHDNPLVEGLRNFGLRAFDASGPLKRWVAQQAMGIAPAR